MQRLQLAAPWLPVPLPGAAGDACGWPLQALVGPPTCRAARAPPQTPPAAPTCWPPAPPAWLAAALYSSCMLASALLRVRTCMPFALSSAARGAGGAGCMAAMPCPALPCACAASTAASPAAFAAMTEPPLGTAGAARGSPATTFCAARPPAWLHAAAAAPAACRVPRISTPRVS